MLLDELVFRLEHYRSASWDGGDHFRFYKIKELVDQYANFFARRGDFRPKRVIEFRILDGGSTASGMKPRRIPEWACPPRKPMRSACVNRVVSSGR